MNNLSKLLNNRFRDTDLNTAKIKSIDRIKGRIVLSMKNGLTTVGTYLHDIADLREGMNVLVGEVNGSHIILNQIENVPRLGTSFSVRRPLQEETGQLLILNFNGEDGATTWVEEAQGLEPGNNHNLKLSTTITKFGMTSLETVLPVYSSFDGADYYKENLSLNDFTWHGWVSMHDLAAWAASNNTNGKANLICIYGNGTNIFIYLSRRTLGSVPQLEKYICGKDMVTLHDSIITNPFSENIMYHLACVGLGRNLYFFIDGQLQNTFTAAGDAPWDIYEADFGINYLPFTGFRLNYDAFELVNYAKWTTNFTPPTHPPVKGIVTV